MVGKEGMERRGEKKEGLEGNGEKEEGMAGEWEKVEGENGKEGILDREREWVNKEEDTYKEELNSDEDDSCSDGLEDDVLVKSDDGKEDSNKVTNGVISVVVGEVVL